MSDLVGESALFALRASGWLAALALLSALSCTPIARLVGRAGRGALALRVTRARRWLGIASAIAASGHAAVAIVSYLGVEDGPTLSRACSAIASTAWLRSGALALAVLAPLLVTSFPRAVRALRVRLWKPLHRLAYVAAALALHHLVLAPFAPRWWVIALTIALIGLALARFSPQRLRGEGAGREERGSLRDPSVTDP